MATTLFDELGPSGTVLLRTGFAAVILVAIWRPAVPRARQRAAARRRPARDRARGHEPQLLRGARPDPAGDRGDARVHGAVRGRGRRIAARQRPACGWRLAAGGIVLLSPGVHGSLDGLGVAFALLAGAFWAAYIVLAARVGRGFSGGQGLAAGDGGGDGGAAPGRRGRRRRRPWRARGCSRSGLAVAVLSSAIPYSLELEALRRLQKGTFGVLMSLEPAVAALVGLVRAGAGPERHRGGRDRAGRRGERGRARRRRGRRRRSRPERRRPRGARSALALGAGSCPRQPVTGRRG